MRNIFVHSLEGEQAWIRHLARAGIDEAEWRQVGHCDQEFKDVEAMRKHMEEVEAEDRAYLEKLQPGDLDKRFLVPWCEASQKRFRVEDVLMHVVEEMIHHTGELICLMWQIDIEPP